MNTAEKFAVDRICLTNDDDDDDDDTTATYKFE